MNAVSTKSTDSPITTDLPIILRLCFTQRTPLYLSPQRRNKTSHTLNRGYFFLRGFE